MDGKKTDEEEAEEKAREDAALEEEETAGAPICVIKGHPQKPTNKSIRARLEDLENGHKELGQLIASLLDGGKPKNPPAEKAQEAARPKKARVLPFDSGDE